ncbi:MAG: tRNA lysidine(34) synthetase TilS [Puniceicoccales bacterium]|jgi:tRNA(Ile)-lysidine synthase|nr:tRNA lysidine(34) synthetase TilS [Puniceicoccales bacterium]
MFCDKDPEKLLAEIRALPLECIGRSRAISHLRMNRHCAAPVCIACSGGSDSVFLVLVFCALLGDCGDFTSNAAILHLNHNLRGEESLQDARFVAELATYLGINFISGTIGECDVSRSEGELRDLRYKFFARQMKAIGSRILLLGHQKNDAAETLVMRLTRASGLDGLAAPREVQEYADGTVRLRPLLGMKKDEIENILKRVGVKWRVDSSNLSNCCFRNVVRNVALKELQKAVPQYDVASNICESRRELVEINEFIEGEACRVIGRNAAADGLDISIFHREPLVVVKRALRKWLLGKNIGIGKREFESLTAAVQGWLEDRIEAEKNSHAGNTFAPNARWDRDIQINAADSKGLILSHGILRTLAEFASEKAVKTNFKFDGWCYGSLWLPNGHLLSQQLHRIENWGMLFACNPRKQAYVECGEGATVSVRNFDPHIEYVGFAHKSPKKLAEILGKDVESYRNHPVVLLDGSPCWVPGLSVSDLHKVKDGSESALLLTYS